MKESRTRQVLLWGVPIALLATDGLQALLVGDLGNGSIFARHIYPLERAALFQLGILGLAWAAFATICRFGPGGREVLARVKSVTWRLALSAAVFCVVGEVALRLVFWNGMSFGRHGGPLVARFERDFRLNRFDGPSRGPDCSAPKAPGTLRVMVLGDSITWGQGVRDEDDLYTSRLGLLLRKRKPQVEVAALARGGRELIGHVEQTRKWGPELQPDVIVYQWYVNDIEIGDEQRPAADRIWRRLFVHPVLVRYSYLWFFLDYQADLLLPQHPKTYRAFLLENFGPGTPGWVRFETLFREWAAAAKALTPRVLVVLFPHLEGSTHPLATIHDQMRDLCRVTGVEVVDFVESLEDFRNDPRTLHATPYDAHPSAEVHARLAEVLDKRLVELWPRLFEPE